MTVADYLLSLLAIVSFAAVCDTIWLGRVRPKLATRFGWRPVRSDERIPLQAWAGSIAVLATLFIFLPRFGVAAGY